MPMPNKGLVKLIEECGECVQAAAIVLANPGKDSAPGREGSLKANLEDEIADVLATADYVIDAMDLDWQNIMLRKNNKIAKFKRWEHE